MILEGVMLTLLILGALNLLFFLGMVQEPCLSDKEHAVMCVFLAQTVLFLLIGFTIMATLEATGQMPN